MTRALDYLRSEWFRYLLAIFVAAAGAVFITDARIVDAEREGCERRQPIFTAVVDLVHEGRIRGEVILAKSKGRNPARYERLKPLVEEYQEKEKIIRAGIVRNCDKAYPHIIPIIE